MARDLPGVRPTALSGYMPHATGYRLQATATVDTDGAVAAAVQQSKQGGEINGHPILGLVSRGRLLVAIG